MIKLVIEHTVHPNDMSDEESDEMWSLDHVNLWHIGYADLNKPSFVRLSKEGYALLQQLEKAAGHLLFKMAKPSIPTPKAAKPSRS